MDDAWNVLKWVLAALAAGFIGQFGKSFALHLIDRKRRIRRVGETGDPVHRAQQPISPLASAEESAQREQAKIEKKRAKAQAKIEKKRIKEKTGDDSPVA